MDLTKAILIATMADLNKILQLEPAIGSTFSEADFTNEDDFTGAIISEVKGICEFKNGEGKYELLQSGDIPLLQKETVEAIRAISPDTAKRLKEVFPPIIKEESPEKKKETSEKKISKNPPNKLKVGKGRIEITTDVFLFLLGKEETKESILSLIDKEYASAGGTSNPNETKWAFNIVSKVFEEIKNSGFKVAK